MEMETLYGQQLTLKCEMCLSITFTVVELAHFTADCFYVVILRTYA